MSRQKVVTRTVPERSILKELHPVISVCVLIVGIVVWAFNTFAQISYVKEQNAAILAVVEQRHKDAIDHSDMNRERMMAVMMDMKESLRDISTRLMGTEHQNRTPASDH